MWETRSHHVRICKIMCGQVSGKEKKNDHCTTAAAGRNHNSAKKYSKIKIKYAKPEWQQKTFLYLKEPAPAPPEERDLSEKEVYHRAIQEAMALYKRRRQEHYVTDEDVKPVLEKLEARRRLWHQRSRDEGGVKPMRPRREHIRATYEEERVAKRTREEEGPEKRRVEEEEALLGEETSLAGTNTRMTVDDLLRQERLRQYGEEKRRLEKETPDEKRRSGEKSKSKIGIKIKLGKKERKTESGDELTEGLLKLEEKKVQGKLKLDKKKADDKMKLEKKKVEDKKQLDKKKAEDKKKLDKKKAEDKKKLDKKKAEDKKKLDKKKAEDKKKLDKKKAEDKKKLDKKKAEDKKKLDKKKTEDKKKLDKKKAEDKKKLDKKAADKKKLDKKKAAKKKAPAKKAPPAKKASPAKKKKK